MNNFSKVYLYISVSRKMKQKNQYAQFNNQFCEYCISRDKHTHNSNIGLKAEKTLVFLYNP